MKRTIWLLALCICCAGCMEMTNPPDMETAAPETGAAQSADATPEAAPAGPTPPPLLAEEDYPRVDGSTATIPLSAALLSRACAIPPEEAEIYVNHSTTNYAYNNLLAGASDLLIVYEPPEGAYEFAAMIGKDFDADIEISPIGRDALVFLVNDANPVRALEREQIQSIYAGDIVNWKDVGGGDMSIDAFQRDADSGSQTLMRKLVMGEIPLMLPTVQMMPGSMGELIEKIVDYDNGNAALGYSVYYYVRNMVGMQNLRMLAVDGVEPDSESIASGAYPYTNDFYAAIRADEPEDSPARALYNFLLSEEGQRLVEAAGYVPIG